MWFPLVGVILIISDSLRADFLGCYGSRDIRTPNIDRLARESAVFDRNYIASYPTVPNRLDIWTGKYNFPFKGWEPLDPKDVTLPEVLSKHGVTTALVFDTPMLEKFDFDRGFSGLWHIRGHHVDRACTDPNIPISLPAAPHKLKHLQRTRQYLRNRAWWRYEKDYIAPRTFEKAIEWLERNYTHDKFFLTVDTWDPHEPFDPPLHYLRMYADLNDEIDNIIYPAYGHCDYMSKAELQRVRALYAGEVTMVDTWVGRLLDAVERFGLAESTMIIFTTDHGHLFGEHGLEGKPVGMLGSLYEVTTRIPLIIHHPEGLASGKRIGGLVQPVDIMPTILDFFNIPIPKTVEGKSILPLMKGEVETLHRYAFSARFPEGYSVGGTAAQVFDGWAGPSQVFSPVTITNERWSLICSPNPEMSELYDLKSDPMQKKNIIDEEKEIADEMRQALISFLEREGAKEQMIAPLKSEDKYIRESLKPTATLYALRDSEGRILAYLTLEEARERLSSQLMSREPKRITFQSLVQKDPKAMVFIEGQYYWAEELSTI